MEVTYIGGARTRARAIAMTRREETSDDDRENSVSVKRRKLSRSNEKLKSHSSTFVQTSTNDCDRIYTTPALLEEDQSDFSTNACTSTRSSGVEASCCSSTRSAEELLKVSDLDQEESVAAETSARNNLDRINESDCFCITSKIQLKTKSDKSESNTTKPVSLGKINNVSHYKVLQEEKIIPPEAELEEFFATVQESLTKRFKDKYNYDIVNDIPLEGRFEWIQVKQGTQNNDYHGNQDD